MLFDCDTCSDVKPLVCTSVLEEGLDVPECNLVIRFQGADTLCTLVQTRERASRKPDSTLLKRKRKGKLRKTRFSESRNMEKAIGRLMESQMAGLQEEEFEVPNVFFSEAQESSENV